VMIQSMIYRIRGSSYGTFNNILAIS
jgi:hypothetical protein